MSMHKDKMRAILLLLPLVFCACLCTNPSLASSVEPMMSKPNCPPSCGNITIPYPFGTTLGCSANSSFLVVCQNSSSPPTLFLPSINMQVLNISVGGTIVVKSPISTMNCTNVQKTVSIGKQFSGSPFTISPGRNTFVVLGCKNSVLLRVNQTVVSGCTPVCGPDYSKKESFCDGDVNCCKTNIPTETRELKYTYQSIEEGGSSCGYAFPVEKTWMGSTKGYGSYEGLRNSSLSNPFDERLVSVPLVLDWELAGANISIYGQCNDPLRGRYFRPSCSDAYNPYRRFPCYVYAANPSLDDDQTTSATNRRCSCASGYRGNPYLDQGCVDIDECKERPDACMGGDCFNEIGSYRCTTSGKSGNASARNIVLITLGSLLGVGCLVLGFIGALRSVHVVVKRFKAHRRRQFFKRNGGLLLEQKLSSNDNGYKKSKLFGSKELAQATDHYSESRVLGRGGQGTVYKGMLTDGTIVAVKKSIKVHETDTESFINEVVILSQINHRNIVKLLGCCLETEIPLLVYEFVPNGTLFQHIHDPSEDFPLTWEKRLRIAVEIANALSYLHSSASAPIFHRDIKSTNILLDEKYRAKISDFGTSRTAAVDQTHVTTRVFGTFGYMDPEYFQSNQFTEKSDVYSFGVVLVELITGEKAISLLRDEEMGRSLAAYFLHSMEEGKLLEIVDAKIVQEEGCREGVETMAELSRRCLQLNGRLRPTMRQVANELQLINKSSSEQISHGSNNHHGASEHSVVEATIVGSHDFSSSMLSLTLER